MFSKATDEWETPQDFFDRLNAEFEFQLDAAATKENSKTEEYCRFVDERANSLTADWASFQSVFLNPPYSQCREFIAKAAREAQKGCTVVCLVPSRTDTKWWHEHVWDDEASSPRVGVEVRFIKGRLKFGGSKNSAPFPSVVVIFRPTQEIVTSAVPAGPAVSI